uniref:Tc1-like transposase DDE domain-containing protein n=1 Tax=Strigamia maritima TaxID=126957 RepID=T1IKA5_STRMM
CPKDNSKTTGPTWPTWKSSTKKELLTGNHRDTRREFAQQNLNRDWSNVVFSDETSVCVGSGRVYVRRPVVDAYDPAFVLAKKKSGRFNVNVWGWMSQRGLGQLCRLTGCLNSRLYIEILDTALLPSARQRFGAEPWVFQHDKAPPHTSNETRNWMAQHMQHIEILQWPAKGADMNPIENIWAVLKSKLQEKEMARNPDELWVQIREIWQEMALDPQLVPKMPLPDIAIQFGCHIKTVRRWAHRWQHENNVDRRAGSGRPSKTNEEEDEQVIMHSLAHPFDGSSKIKAELQLPVAPRTIRRRLGQHGLHGRVAQKKSY